MGWASNRTNLWFHFAHRNAQDTIGILEEGNQPYPWYPKCDMFVSHNSLNVRNPVTEFLRRG